MRHQDYCTECHIELRHIGCRGTACSYTLVVCEHCDRVEDAKAMLADHEKDCRQALLNRRSHMTTRVAA